MRTRRLGPFTVSSIALGCMSLSRGYGDRPDRAGAEAVLNGALDPGFTLLDTATVYGMGANETLIGEVLGKRRGEFTLASKCGPYIADGKRVIGKLAHLAEDAGADAVSLSADVVGRAGEIINRHTVQGPRYNAANQLDIDTEEFAA